MLIKAYLTSSGRSPVEAYIEGLPKNEQEEIYALFEDLKEHGLGIPVVSMRQISGGSSGRSEYHGIESSMCCLTLS